MQKIFIDITKASPLIGLMNEFKNTIMKKLLITLSLLVSFSSFGQIQTEEFKMGYKKGYKDGYFKANGNNYNGVLDFEKVLTWVEIIDTLMGSSYSDIEKDKNYERGYYQGYYYICGCVCSGQWASGDYRTEIRRIKKISGNIYKYHTNIDRLKRKLKKAKGQTKKNKILRDIDSNQEMVTLIMSSCNWYL